tara:strand:+ start:423 stop:611 length:189 start_codon:yes stop_codon:yes gene_type:complete
VKTVAGDLLGVLFLLLRKFIRQFICLVIITVPKITRWGYVVADALLQLFNFRETSLRLSIPD